MSQIRSINSSMVYRAFLADHAITFMEALHEEDPDGLGLAMSAFRKDGDEGLFEDFTCETIEDFGDMIDDLSFVDMAIMADEIEDFETGYDGLAGGLLIDPGELSDAFIGEVFSFIRQYINQCEEGVDEKSAYSSFMDAITNDLFATKSVYDDIVTKDLVSDLEADLTNYLAARKAMSDCGMPLGRTRENNQDSRCGAFLAQPEIRNLVNFDTLLCDKYMALAYLTEDEVVSFRDKVVAGAFNDLGSITMNQAIEQVLGMENDMEVS